MLQLKRVPKKVGRETAVFAASQRYLRLSLILLVFGLIVLLPSLAYAASVSKSNGTDGAADGSSITRTVEFTGSDFTSGAAISSVTATIEFAKIDAPDAGSCFSVGHQGGSPFNREIYMYLTSPEGTKVGLVENAANSGGSSPAPPHYTYTSNNTYNGTVIVTFDDAAALAVGGPAPANGTFRPEQPLAAFMDEDPVGTWTLTIGDSVPTAPVCFYDFSLTVNAEQPPVVNNQIFSVDEDSPADTSVGNIVANDADPGDKLTYTVTGGSGQSVFAVDVLMGEITVVDASQLTDPGVTTPSAFTLNVRVTDSAALFDDAVITINVDNVNDAPVITESDTVSVTMSEDSSPTPFSLTLNATDQDGDTLNWSIDTQGSHGTAGATTPGTSSTISYAPTADYNGSDSFIVEVDDGNGGTDTITVNVTIDPVNDNPDAVNDTPTVAEDSSNNTLDVLANDTDAPDSGETLTITAVGTTNNGGIAANNTTDITYTPAANFSGTEVFTYTISDQNGGFDTATVTVTVTGENDPPVIDQTDPTGVTMDEDGAPTAFSLPLTATDVDGDPLIWSIQSQGGHGTASIAGMNPSNSMSINYMPTANYNGGDSFVVLVSDGKGGTDTITVNVTVNPVNDDPDAVDDGYTVDENTSNNMLAVLLNDTNPDSGETLAIEAVGTPNNNGIATINGTNISYTPFTNFFGTEVFTYTIGDGTGRFDTATVTVTVREVNEAPVITEGATYDAGSMDEDGSPTAFANFTLNATDGDGDSLIWSIQSQGTFGTASITGSNPSDSMGITYVPNANMNGVDSFVVRVSDGRGGTDDITVSIIVVAQNDNPDAVDDTFSVDEQSSNNTLTPLANDTDYPDSGETLTITAVGTPNNGGSVTNNGNNLTYTPLSTFMGTEVFTYTIGDGNGGSDTATISVSVDDVNFAPTITQGASTSVTMSEDGSPTAFSLTLNATDPDGNTLTWSIQSQGSHGTAAASGTGTSKAISYTPVADYFGSDSFVVRVGDGFGGSDTIIVNVTIQSVNDAPTAVDDSQSAQPETAVVINVLTNDSDPENDTLTITAVTQGSKGTVNNNGNTVTYTGNAGEAGSDSFTYTISDGNGGSDTATVNVQLGTYDVFIPLVMNNFVSAPDLVVTGIDASSDLIEVTIENQGNQATSSGFWVDFYINPNPVPTHENQLWDDLSTQGLVWGVDVSIGVGESLTLSYSTDPSATNDYYSADDSSYDGNLPVGTPVYAQVDSAHLNTTYGGVLETHEILGTGYNNVSGQYTASAIVTATTQLTASMALINTFALPLR